jgi:heterodisulfide reductase subunit C
MSEENKFTEFERGVLELGHLIKYNLYMLAKSVVFHSIAPSTDSPQEAVEATNLIMEQLDLEFQRLNQNKPSEE